MKTIYKYELEVKDGIQEVYMPDAADIIHVGEQNGKICMWAEVDTTNISEQRYFHVIGTGHPIPNTKGIPTRSNWTGTVQMPPFVWHVYEVY